VKKLRCLYVELYGFNVYYIRCSHSEYNVHIKREFGCRAPVVDLLCRGKFEVYERDSVLIGVIWLHPGSDIGHLVHECFHCVHYFLDYKGLVLSSSSEEAYAYLLEYLLNKTSVILRGRL